MGDLGEVRPTEAAEAVRYKASERAWVMRLLARLTPDQRARYEAECTKAPRHHHSGKLYDDAKAAIAERIMLDDARRQ